MPSPLEHQHTERPRASALLRALLSFMSSLAVVVLLFFVIGQHTWFDPSPATGGMSGVFVTPDAETAPSAVSAFAVAAFALKFIDEERVEVRSDDTFYDAYYRVERQRVIIESIGAGGRPDVWVFDLDGDHLVAGPLVLQRRVD